VDIAQLLASMALEVHDQPTPQDTVDRIGYFARDAVAGDDAGILLSVARREITTIAATSDRVQEAHASQAATNEGPCLDSIYEGAPTYRCNDTSSDPRWPVWGPLAKDLGVRSVVSVRLATNDRKLGSLNVYASRPDAFSSEDANALEFLAAHASVAIATALHGEQLLAALDSRTVIGQAQGMLMVTFGLTAEGAFLYLRRISQDSNRKLAAIAQEIVDDPKRLRAHLPDR